MNFRPLHDRVVVKRIDAEEKTAGGIIIPDTAKEKPSQGEIVAVGPGGRDETGKLIPIDLKVGDRYNTTINVTGTNTWIVTVTITPPQKISTTWNTTPTWDSTGNIMTARPNGNGNSFGFTTMFNGNSTARPTATCRTA